MRPLPQHFLDVALRWVGNWSISLLAVEVSLVPYYSARVLFD